jgi:DNA-binding SARP family transcriptional activator
MDNDDYGNFELELLQSWQLRQGGAVVHVAARQQRLIAVLAVRGGSLRNYLAGLLWPEYPEPKALESLRVTVHLITRQVPGLVVKSGPLLSLDTRTSVDLHRVRSALKAAGTADTTAAGQLLQDLRGLDFLPGWYEDWVLFEQSRLRHDQLRAFTVIAHRLADAGDYGAASDAAVAALELEPLYESAVRVLVTSELAQGNLAAALFAYDKYRDQLQRDMGVPPSEALRQLIHGLRPQAARTSPAQEPLVAAGGRLGQQPLLHNVQHLVGVSGGNSSPDGA